MLPKRTAFNWLIYLSTPMQGNATQNDKYEYVVTEIHEDSLGFKSN